MGHNIPKIEYGSVIPTVIVFDYPPRGFGDPEQYDVSETKSVSLSGIEQVSINYTEVTRKVAFSMLTETLKAAMLTFFRSHAKFGRTFKYYEDIDDVTYTTYSLKDLKFSPKKIAIAGENEFFYEIPLTLRRADDVEAADYMEVTINNGQAVAADVTGLVLDSADYRTVKIFCEIVRKTSSAEKVSNGFLTAIFLETTSAWQITDIGTFDGNEDHGVRFSMDGDQVQYTSDTMAGTGYEGVIRLKNFTITSG